MATGLLANRVQLGIRRTETAGRRGRRELASYLETRPALETIYRFKQRLCYLLLKKHRTRKQCEHWVPRFLRAVYQLRQAGLAPLVQLGQTLQSWSEEIAALWRFTRNNGITEGFHNKMARPTASAISTITDLG